MPDHKKIDWTESDLIIEQLRAKLQEDAEPAPEALVVETVPEALVVETAPEAPVAEVAPEALVVETAPEALVVETAPEALVAEAAPEAEAPAPTAPRTRGARKKRHRMPKPEAVLTPIEEAPLDAAAREAKKERAAALAREQETDLYWRTTPAPLTPLVDAIPEGEAQVAPQSAPEAEAPKAEAPEAEVPKVDTFDGEEPTLPLAASRRKGIRESATVTSDSEMMANVTVEGLLNDIFGSTAGPAGRTWLEPEKPAPTPEEPKEQKPPKAHAKREPEEKPIAHVAVERVTEAVDSNAPTLELGGYRIVLPTEEAAPTEPKREKPAEAPVTEAPAPEAERVKLFSAFSVKREKEGALPKPSIARLSAERMEFKRSLEESEEDFQLLVDLDYEDELGEVIGFEQILDYHERRINGRSRDPQDHRHEKRKFEYTTHAHDIGLSKFYAKQRRRHLVNLTVTALLLLFLFFYERSAIILSLFGEENVGTRYPLLYIAVGLVFFLIGVVLLRRHLIGGFLQLLRLAPSDYSICSVLVLLTLGYHAALFFAPAGSAMSLYLSPAMGSLCLLALSGLFNWYREFSAFRVISSKQQKYALLPRISVGNREGNAKLRLFENEQNERVWYVRPIGFVRNYFANTEKKTDHQRAFGAQLLLVLAIAVALSLYTLAMGGDARSVLHTAFVAFLVTAPIISVLGTSLPMFAGTCLRLGRRGAIVGENTVYQCGGKTALVLPDHACFKPMPHEQFELVKNCDAERATILIRALLDKLESPLAATVLVPQERMLSPDTITLTDIDEFGVAAVASGERKTPILLGSVAYLQKYGIRVSPKKDGRYEEVCRNMLCVAINNRLTALFIAHYRPETDMLTLADMLEAEDVRLAVRSKDPGIHGPLMAEVFADVHTPPEVVKPLAVESKIATDRVDATVVALGSAREAAKAFATCRRIRRAIKLGTLWQLVSILFGALLAGALVFFDVIPVLPAFAVALYTFLWSGAHALTSYFMLRDKEENE